MIGMLITDKRGRPFAQNAPYIMKHREEHKKRAHIFWPSLPTHGRQCPFVPGIPLSLHLLRRPREYSGVFNFFVT